MIDYRLTTAFTLLVVIVLFGAPIVLGVLVARGRGILNSIHRPRLGWAAVGCYLALGLLSVLILVVGGDDESRDDGPLIVIGLIGFPWSLLIIGLFQAFQVVTHAPVLPGLLYLFQGLALAVPFGLNCAVAYQLGKRLPVLWAARPVPRPQPLFADPRSRAILRRSLVACAALALVGAGWWYASRPRTDADLVAAFRSHRPDFEQLVQMYIADDRDMLIDADGSYRMRPAYPAPEGPGYPAPERLNAYGKPFPTTIVEYPPGYPVPQPTATSEARDSLTEARRAEYVALLKRAGLVSIWPGALNHGLWGSMIYSRDYPGPHRIVRLVVSLQKMFIFAQEPLQLASSQEMYPPPSTAPLAEGVLALDGAATTCRQFEDHWYLCSRGLYDNR